MSEYAATVKWQQEHGSEAGQPMGREVLAEYSSCVWRSTKLGSDSLQATAPTSAASQTLSPRMAELEKQT